ncbi:helix-turn-helix domain-containing protein [Pseudofrankia inefficax]|uniref:Putative DNA-binding protein n=1 Tax=Pseudofrankia inefficax (strain DSM 45817 / CECT 9037 / DDB 130130 / EuI1c) TaxID=298654 RepID=E3J6B8_PSEI1|nr:helix-turn-helix transcriptional regulator [Pseudofrankia inefficax]ADP79545.1 putative DNA-binding protein [Pseudofrankia inefficax]
MTSDRPRRHCSRCGHRLAADNRAATCSACQSTATSDRGHPPDVPNEFWRAVAIGEAIATWHMGRVIYAYRCHPWHGQALPQELVAGWLGLTQAQLSRIENGRAPEELSKLVRYSQILGIPADLLWFDRPGDPRQRQPADPPRSRESDVELLGVAAADGGGGPYRVLAEVGEVIIVAVDRRTFLAGSGAGLLVGGQAVPVESPGQVAGQVVDHLTGQIESFYAAEAVYGPRAVIPSVLVQQELTRQLVGASRGAIRQDLLRTSAAYTGRLTWLRQDAGDFATASQWANETLELSHRVGDAQLIRHALVNKAMICTDQRDGAGTLDLTDAALADEAVLCAKVRVQALQQSAHGHALLGDRTATDTALDQASALLARVDDDYPWYNACRRTPNYLEAQRATCYNRLGLGTEARTLWEQVIGALPPGARRDAGVYQTRLALSYAQAEQPDEAVGAIDDAVTIARETGSARLRQELHDVWHQLTPWHDAQPGREAKDLLATL